VQWVRFVHKIFLGSKFEEKLEACMAWMTSAYKVLSSKLEACMAWMTSAYKVLSSLECVVRIMSSSAW
jgi:hypothetical protein